jgi:hypothetical protein
LCVRNKLRPREGWELNITVQNYQPAAANQTVANIQKKLQE